MHLSVIIPAHNEERLIADTIRALLHAAGEHLDDGQFEVIVVDDASKDRSGDAARAAGAQVVRVEHHQISRARNAGIPHARGRILLWVDADTLVPPQAIGDVLSAIDRGAAAGGSPVVFDGPVPLWSRLALPLVLALFRLVRQAGGCFLFCTRQALDALAPDGRLWDESVFAGEEILLCARLRGHAGRRRFHLIRTPVVTSGRKLRAHSGGEVLWVLLGVMLRGRRGVSSRQHLAFWYAPRRPD